jgi:ATP-dependent RNA helicase RhlE
MFDMGFAPQINRIIQALPKERQTMLFSATMPDEIMKLAGHHMRLPTRVEVAAQGTVAEKVDQQLYVVNRTAKPDLLNKLLQTYGGSVLLFVRTKHNARKIAALIREMGHNAAEIHSNRSLSQRREALDGFKAGKYRILVAADIAARGIDVTGIELVINYDLPDDENNYIHRIGRTGRAGKSGRAVSFAAPDQASEVRGIEKLIRMPLPIITHPDMPPASFNGPAHQQTKGQGSGKPSGGGHRTQGRPSRPGAGYQRPSSAPRSAFKSFPERGRSSGNAAPGRRPGPDRNSKPDPMNRKDGARAGGRPPYRPASGDPKGRVSQSPYFEGEAPGRGRHEQRRGGSSGSQRHREQPREEIKKTAGQGGWFSKFLKKK